MGLRQATEIGMPLGTAPPGQLARGELTVRNQRAVQPLCQAAIDQPYNGRLVTLHQHRRLSSVAVR